MMVFSDERTAAPLHPNKPHRRRWLIVVVILLVFVSGFWMLKPTNKTGSTFDVASPDGATTINGDLTGLDGKHITSAVISIADNQGNPTSSVNIDQYGKYEVTLQNGVYIFSVNAKGQQLIKQVKVDPDSPKQVDFQMNVGGDL